MLFSFALSGLKIWMLLYRGLTPPGYEPYRPFGTIIEAVENLKAN
jgi:hypothetical protein